MRRAWRLVLFASLVSFCAVPWGRVQAFSVAQTPATLALGAESPDDCGTTVSEGLNSPRDVVISHGKVLVADFGNHRVLIWNSIPTVSTTPPDIILGQTDVCGSASATTQSGLSQPSSVSYDGTRLFVAEATNNRVLVWNTFPTSNGQAADLVLGQPNFTSNTANNGGVSAHSLRSPFGIYSDGTHLFVGDTSNNRVLIWNSIPTTNNQDADLVLGQPNFTSATANNGGISAHSLATPAGVHFDGTRLSVTDYGNNRVLIWNSLPTTNNQNADVVLGQPNFTSNTANNGGVSAHSLSGAVHAFSDGTHFFVTDQNNHRTLVWNSIPTTNNQDADLVLGQPNFTSNTANNGGVSAHSMASSYGVSSDGTRLFVAEATNNRVLVWNSLPTSNGEDADMVLRKLSLSTAVSGMNQPYSATVAGNRFFVADTFNHRVLIWNSLPTTNNEDPDVVLGQPDFANITANNGGVSAHSLNTPVHVYSDGTRLFVADYANHRVLIWNSIPTTNNQDADLVLGQPNFSSTTTNNGGVSAHSMSLPVRVHFDGTHLFVLDQLNHRVLVWNSLPTSNNQDADLVLGQPNFTSNTANNGGISAHSLNQPFGLYSDGNRLFVTEPGNQRVLIWNSIPTTNNQDADLVLGQPNFTSNTANNGGISAHSLSSPGYAYFDGTRLFVADVANNRVLVWNSLPIADNQNADLVLGQPDFTSATSNNGGVSAHSLKTPECIFADSTYVYVSDTNNHRILLYPRSPQGLAVSLSASLTNTTQVTVNLEADDATDVMISQSSDFTGASWQTYASSIPFTLDTTQGGQHVYVKFRDHANYVSSVFDRTVTYDSVAPAKVDVDSLSFATNKGFARLKSRSNNYTNQERIKFSGTNTQATNGSVKLYEGTRYGSKTLLETASIDADGKWRLSAGKLKDGKHTLFFRFIDQAGNESSVSKEVTLIVDTEKPTISTPFPELLTQLRSVPIAFPFTDKTTDIDRYQVKLLPERKSWRSQDEDSYFIPASIPNGLYTFLVRAFDKAGNRKEEQVTVKVVDRISTPRQRGENAPTADTNQENTTDTPASVTSPTQSAPAATTEVQSESAPTPTQTSTLQQPKPKPFTWWDPRTWF